MSEETPQNTAPTTGDGSNSQAVPALNARKPRSANVNINLDAASLKRAGENIVHFLAAHAFLLVFIVLVGIYTFLILQINSYSSPIVTDADVQNSDTPLPALQIDEAAARRLQSLKDNSVNVQALFQQDRTNPF